MLTKAQAQIVMMAIDDSAHSEKIVFHGPNQYSVAGVDRATGYPFEVYDFDDWQARRASYSTDEYEVN